MPTFLQTPLINPFAACALAGGTPPFQPAASTRPWSNIWNLGPAIPGPAVAVNFPAKPQLLRLPRAPPSRGPAASGQRAAWHCGGPRERPATGPRLRQRGPCPRPRRPAAARLWSRADTHLRRTPSSSSGSSGARRALEAASGRAPVCARPGPHPGAAAPARSRPGRGTRLGRSALPGRAGLAGCGRAGRGRRRGLAGRSQHGPGEDECFMGSCGLTRGIRPVSPPARAGRGRGGAWRRAGRSPGRAARARTGGYRVQDPPAGGGRGDEGAWRAVQVAGGAQPPGARATRGPRQRRRIPEEAAAPAGDRRHRVPERAVGAGSRAWRPSLAESRRECWASEGRSWPLRGPPPACPLNPFA